MEITDLYVKKDQFIQIVDTEGVTRNFHSFNTRALAARDAIQRLNWQYRTLPQALQFLTIEEYYGDDAPKHAWLPNPVSVPDWTS